MSPTVSVIIPCYNSAAFVADAIESVRAQSVPASEILVVDDGSTDGSADVVRRFGAPVRLLQQPNRGVSAARNLALAEATGDYILFLDADDTITPDALARLTAAANATHSNTVLMGYREFGPVSSRPQQFLWDVDGFFPSIIAGNFGPNHTRLVPRRAAVAAGGFPVGMKIYEDWYFWTLVALLGTPLVSLDFVGGLYRRHEASCLAAPDERAVASAYMIVATLQCERMPADRPDIVARYGDQLFWSGWTAYKRAAAAQLPSAEVARLASAIRQLTRSHQFSMAGSSFVTLTRLAGLPVAEAVRSMLSRATGVASGGKA